MKKPDEGIIKDSYEIIINELQTLLTVSYILVVGIGMLFAFQKYQLFGINIFDYADIFDFLITPFADFQVIGFFVASIVFSLLIIKYDIYIKNNKPRYYSKIHFGLNKKKWFKTLKLLLYTFISIFYLIGASIIYGDFAKQRIEKQDVIEVKFIDGETKTGILIGKTSEVLFLKKNDKISVIPIKSMLKEIEIK